LFLLHSNTLYRRSSVQAGQLWWRPGGFGELEREVRYGVVVTLRHWWRLNNLLGLLLRLGLYRLHRERLRLVRWWGGFGPVNTGVGTPVEAAETVAGTICVPLAWAPAVRNSPGTFLRSQAGSWTLSDVSVSASSGVSKGSGSGFVQSGGGGAVNIEPPVTHKYLLVKHGSVRTHEGDGIERVRADWVPQTDVIHLTLLLRVSVVATEGEAVTGEGGVLGSGVNGIVNPGLSWDGVS